MAWCKSSSLIAAVSRTLRSSRFPKSRSQVLRLVDGKVVEGWQLDYFLAQALTRRSYPDLQTVMADLEDWLDAQG
jgi:hypothetical protein